MDFAGVLSPHLESGVLSRINDTTFGVTSPRAQKSAVVRLLPGRATVEFEDPQENSGDVPSSLVLREQMKRFGGSFYASPQQLAGFLAEMSLC